MAASSKASMPVRALYRPVGLLSGMVGGLVASMLFKQAWRRVSPHGDEGDPPSPLQREYPLREVMAAAVLQGAIFAGIRALIDRQGARVFERATGEWPGN